MSQLGMIAKDYQWPHARPLPPYFETTDWNQCLSLYAEIETAFTCRFGVPAILLPSGRSALAAIFDFSGISRKHLIFSPKWSSHCVWDVIGRVANPTTVLARNVDVCLAVHKWGYSFGFEQKLYEGIVIEDSVDSLITHPAALFPSGGDFEVISLPKTIGSFCGGLVLTNNAEFISHIHQRRLSDIDMVKHQSLLKYKKHTGDAQPFYFPEAVEPINRGLDLIGLQHILACMPLYDLNVQTITSRIKRLNTYFGIELIGEDIKRLPCIYPAKRSSFDVITPTSFMERYFNWTLSLQNDSFEPCWLLPLHFGISDEEFEVMLHALVLRHPNVTGV